MQHGLSAPARGVNKNRSSKAALYQEIAMLLALHPAAAEQKRSALHLSSLLALS